MSQTPPDVSVHWMKVGGHVVRVRATHETSPRLTPSGLWYRCRFCGKLYPSHERRVATIALHHDAECTHTLDGEPKEPASESGSRTKARPA